MSAGDPAGASPVSCSTFSLLLQNLLDAWLGLWQWVFQPAIGVLMLGAVSAPRGRGKGCPNCVVHTCWDAWQDTCCGRYCAVRLA